MKNWELLAAIDHEMMLMDINLMEWQGHLDMAALAGVGQPLELWTDDIPPRVITKETLSKAAGKPVRVMHMQDGEWGQVGTGKIDAEGNLTAEITEDVPQLMLNTLRHFSLRRDLPLEPSPYETLVMTPGSGVVETSDVSFPHIPYRNFKDRVKELDTMEINPNPKRSLKGHIDLDNHPFFRDDAMNRRCTDCEHIVRECVCKPKKEN